MKCYHLYLFDGGLDIRASHLYRILFQLHSLQKKKLVVPILGSNVLLSFVSGRAFKSFPFSPTGPVFRFWGTTFSAVALSAKGADLSPPIAGFWLADNDFWDVPHPTPSSGVSETHVAVTSKLFVVLVMIVYHWGHIHLCFNQFCDPRKSGKSDYPALPIVRVPCLSRAMSIAAMPLHAVPGLAPSTSCRARPCPLSSMPIAYLPGLAPSTSCRAWPCPLSSMPIAYLPSHAPSHPFLSTICYPPKIISSQIQYTQYDLLIEIIIDESLGKGYLCLYGWGKCIIYKRPDFIQRSNTVLQALENSVQFTIVLSSVFIT
ncbi:Uncharacterized protein FWK35_00016878 [Aphis craccivora]|uniref:Uncharacterized protein n=1 Tax=Aphis craccivora TaxID=307492 RepID=A0A6G0X7M5_APHCR|nr:Uncharacterized protein FWK35_00016878 [Aphis craccivora]